MQTSQAEGKRALSQLRLPSCFVLSGATFASSHPRLPVRSRPGLLMGRGQGGSSTISVVEDSPPHCAVVTYFIGTLIVVIRKKTRGGYQLPFSLLLPQVTVLWLVCRLHYFYPMSHASWSIELPRYYAAEYRESTGRLTAHFHPRRGEAPGHTSRHASIPGEPLQVRLPYS